MPQVIDTNPQAALGFLVNQKAYIEPQVYQIKYPDLKYSGLVYVDTSAPDWAESVVVRSMDMKGELQFLGPNSEDVKAAQTAYAQGAHALKTAALGYGYSIEEIGQAMYLGTNLDAERAMGTRRLVEQGLNKLALLGNEAAGYKGLYNYAGVSTETSASTLKVLINSIGTNGVQPIVTFFKAALNKVYVTNTNTTYRPTNVTITPEEFELLDSTIIPNGSNETVMQFLIRNLRNVSISDDVNLIGAGASSSNRMVVHTNSREAAKFHLNMPMRFLQPATADNINFFVPAIVRTGGTEVRIPKTMHYVDGI